MNKLTQLTKANTELTHANERQTLLLADLSRKLQQQDTVRPPLLTPAPLTISLCLRGRPVTFLMHLWPRTKIFTREEASLTRRDCQHCSESGTRAWQPACLRQGQLKAPRLLKVLSRTANEVSGCMHTRQQMKLDGTAMC